MTRDLEQPGAPRAAPGAGTGGVAGHRPVGEVLDDLAAAMDAARRELLVAADGAEDVLGRLSRDDALVELRTRVTQALDLHEQLQIGLRRAASTADLAGERLRRQGEQLRALEQHPKQAREHLGAAAEFLAEATSSSLAAASRATGAADVGPRTRQDLQELGAGLPLVQAAAEQVCRALADGQDRVAGCARDLTVVTDELRAGVVSTAADRAAVGLDEQVGQVRDDVRRAGLSGEAGAHQSFVMAAAAAQARSRLHQQRPAHTPDRADAPPCTPAR